MTPATEAAPDTRRLLTSSRLRSARSCRRQHHLEYDLQYRPAAEADAQRLGTLVHKGLEAWWKAAQQGLTGDALLLAVSVALNAAATPETDAFERVRAEVMLTGYHERWAADLALYEVLGVEVEFVTDLVNPLTGRRSETWRLGGKLDVLVRERATGLVAVVEHKTSSEDIGQGSEYWRKLRMDGQVSVYFVGAAALGFAPASCLYDVLGKPGQRPLKATPEEERKYTKAKPGEPSRLYANQREANETPAEFRARLTEAVSADPEGYYQRGTVVRLEQELADSMLDVWQLAQELRAAELVARYPRNPGACSQFGRLCAFFDVCTNCASLDDPSRFKRLDTPHPELSQH